MPQERAEKRIDELVHIGTVSDTAKVPMEDGGEAYYAEVGQLGIPRSADVDDENAIVSFKDGAGVVLFTVDLAGMSGSISFGKLVVSTNTLTIEEEQTGTFTVVLQEEPSQNQTVYIAVSDNTKIAVSPAVLTFTPQNWNVAQTVTVTALPDADSDDEAETITLTSRKVPSKQISVSVTDITEPPIDLISDGLGLYFNLRNGNSGLTDSIGGVVATNNNGTFSDNGYVIEGSNQLIWKYPIPTNVPNGFTFEFVLSSNVVGAKNSIPEFDAAGTGYGTGYAFKADWHSTYLNLGFAYIANGSKVTQGTVPIGGDYANTDFSTEHTFAAVYNADGSAFVSLDGVKQGSGRSAPSGFERYEVSGSPQFKLPYNAGVGTRKYEIAGIRFYNRALTETELLNNHRHDVQQQANATFTGGQAE